jgi:hypothetical protein
MESGNEKGGESGHGENQHEKRVEGEGDEATSTKGEKG